MPPCGGVGGLGGVGVVDGLGGVGVGGGGGGGGVGGVGTVLQVPAAVAVSDPAGQVTVAVSIPLTSGGATVFSPLPFSVNDDVVPVDQATVTVSPWKLLYSSVSAVQVRLALVMWFASAAGASTRNPRATLTAPRILLFTCRCPPFGLCYITVISVM